MLCSVVELLKFALKLELKCYFRNFKKVLNFYNGKHFYV